MTDKMTSTPDFLIVGAAKSGTTSLHNYLNMHPKIYLPDTRKELYFWHVATNTNRSIIHHVGKGKIPTRLDEYLEYYRDASDGQITGEACPSYLFFYKHVLSNLKKYHVNWQDVKIIIILREPVSRIISQYRFVCKKRLDPDFLSFSDSLKAEPFRLNENKHLPDLFYTEVSKYTEQVRFYLENFNNVHVCLYDDLKENPRNLLDQLCIFLGVDKEQLPDFKFEVFNASSDAKKLKYPLLKNSVPKLAHNFLRWLPKSIKLNLKTKFEDIVWEPVVVPSEEIESLKKKFKEEISSLEKTLDRDLSSWK